MSLVLPPLADGMLSLLGVDFPDIDEDEIRKDADAWRTVLAGTSAAGAGADAAVRGTRQVYHGDSATALAAHWHTTGAGHLEQATTAARVAPVALDGVGSKGRASRSAPSPAAGRLEAGEAGCAVRGQGDLVEHQPAARPV